MSARCLDTTADENAATFNVLTFNDFRRNPITNLHEPWTGPGITGLLNAAIGKTKWPRIFSQRLDSAGGLCYALVRNLERTAFVLACKRRPMAS